MQRTILAFALMAALLLPQATAQAESAESPCRQAKDDPAGDTTVPAGVPVFDSAPADFLGVELAWLDEGAQLTVQLNGDPRAAGAGPMTYSYWVGFEDGGLSASGNSPTWTFQGSTTYDMIETMYWDGPQEYPVTWDGNTFSFIVPWSSFEEQYGSAWPVEFGSPRASSGGPSAGGLNNPSEDSVVYDFDLVPLQPCPKVEGAEASGGAASVGEQPGGGSGGSASGGGSPGSGSAAREPEPGEGAEAAEAAGAVAQRGAVRGDAPAEAPGPVAAILGLTLLALATARRRR